MVLRSRRPEMKLKQAIIALLSREALTEPCRVFEVESGGRRREEMMRQVMRRESILPEHALEFLTEAQTRAVCEAHGISGTTATILLKKK